MTTVRERFLMMRTMLPLIGVLLLSAPIALAQSVNDPSLTVNRWITGLDHPTGMAFIPGTAGDSLVIEKNTGRVKLVRGKHVAGVALDLAVNNRSERGLLGIALSPTFARDRFVYLYYTASSTGGD